MLYNGYCYSFRVVNQKDIVPHLPPCAKDYHDLDKDTSKPCDPSNTEMAYHHGTEIWYPSGMGPTSKYGQYLFLLMAYRSTLPPRYIECLGEPKGEDFHCSDSVKFEFADSEQYVWDHRHYYGQSACPDHVIPATQPIHPTTSNKFRPQSGRAR